MAPVSQVSDQNAIIKRRKLHRAPPEIARKIVAFEEIISANSMKSERELVKLLNLPNSTMQTWRAQKIAKEVTEDEVAIFFATPTGSVLLCRIAVAIMYNNKCGASGICGAQECLRHAGLDKYVATSSGVLQNFWMRCQDCILSFGKQWEEKLAEKMSTRKITVILDEMFRKKQPCLVAIEAMSNYILLEKFTEDRTAETWRKELENAIEDLPVTVGQITSDLCGTIRSLANEYGATHSPDIFGHVHLFGQFSAGCEAPICCAFLLIYGALAMDASKIAASGASRLAEILPAKVNKAIFFTDNMR